ncbi:sugar ABC transporter substrate-binding protein [Alkalihalobacillus hwajinpoensis]|uniref:sugar ABC transporter substrate-binding protein n=1 Tax=Guptibacillus hwajinpoensis TaxID=208199 RepID=UPI0018837645|nr:sugar ABC transporter substrate-binding protein [Pseudalkalibacillus hwajinpoensis]MBF0706038.1 sugar ABC transporter substrate-binding protein [Pseudalkalibacillus hwajinpoensis]
MKKGKLLSFIVFTLILSLMAGCSGNIDQASGTDEGADGGEDKLKIGVSYQNLQNEFIINIQNALNDKAEELGIELIESDGQGKAEEQIAHIENFISQKVDAIILNPYDKFGTVPAVEKAVAADIPIIIVNSQVDNLEKATAFVGSDDVIAGELEMEYVAKKLGGEGNVAIIHGPNGNSAEIGRTEGNKNVLEQYPDINVVAEQTANWDRAQALSLVENWLQSHDDISAIVAQNDEMALGAYNTVEAAGKEDEIIVVGIDAIPDALNSVGDGKLAATVFQDGYGQGEAAFEVAVKAARGEEVEDTTYIPFQLVTQENLDEFK